jgi:7,8-dihydropterin-6-yl-methyl-4-(beta-D-ribofuranosyl)aminobenzene 5'-phosphate synthase
MKSIVLFAVVAGIVMLMPSGALASEPRPLKLAVLCDDTVLDDRYATEHGMSVLVELPNGHRWLFDTGTTDVYLENARRMGLSLDGLTGIALSHGHDDHTGGLTFYPRLGGAPPVYGHPYVWHKTYQVKAGEPVRVCGMPYLARKNAQPAFRAVSRTTRLDEDLYLLADIPRAPGSYAPIQGNFFNEDGTGPCPLLDDATLVVRTARGLVVLFGCGHAGYTNILAAVRKEFSNEKLLSVVGGLHLANASETVLDEAVRATTGFRAAELSFYGGHCTGEKAIAHFEAALGDAAVRPLGAGRQIEY